MVLLKGLPPENTGIDTGIVFLSRRIAEFLGDGNFTTPRGSRYKIRSAVRLSLLLKIMLDSLPYHTYVSISSRAISRHRISIHQAESPVKSPCTLEIAQFTPRLLSTQQASTPCTSYSSIPAVVLRVGPERSFDFQQ